MTGHFNGLTPAEAERLAVLMEECAEVQHAIGKVLRHGFESRHPKGGPINRALLAKELGHLSFAVQLMIDERDLQREEISAEAALKSLTVYPYLHHQRAQSPGAAKTE